MVIYDSAPTSVLSSLDTPIRFPNPRQQSQQEPEQNQANIDIQSFTRLPNFAQNNFGIGRFKEIAVNETLPVGSKLYSATLSVQGLEIPILILDLPNGQRRIRVEDKLHLNGIKLRLDNGAFKSLEITTGPLAGTEFKAVQGNSIAASYWKASLGPHTIDLDPNKNEMTLTIGEGPFSGARCKWDPENKRFIGLSLSSDLGMCTLNINFGTQLENGKKSTGSENSAKAHTSSNKGPQTNPEFSLTVNEGNFAGTTLQYDRTKERFSGRLTTALEDSIVLTCTIPKRPTDPLAFSGVIGEGDSAIQFSTSGGKSNTLTVDMPIGQLGNMSIETNSDQRIQRFLAEFSGFAIQYSDGSTGFDANRTTTDKSNDNNKEDGNPNEGIGSSAESLTRRVGLDRFPVPEHSYNQGFNLTFDKLNRDLSITSARFDTSGRIVGGSAAFRFGNSENAITGDIISENGELSVAIKAPLVVDGVPADLKLKYFASEEFGGLWEGEFTRGSQTFKLQYHDGEWRLFGKKDNSYSFLTGLNRDGQPFFAGSYTTGKDFNLNLALSQGNQARASLSWERRF